MIEEQVAAAKPAFQESLIHIECCMEKAGYVALCGTELLGKTPKPVGTEDCVVCVSINHTSVRTGRCPVDGAPCDAV